MDQKLTFLKREDIRTMAKDLARLQEEEAAKEKDRISTLKTEEKSKKYASEKERLVNTFIPKKNKSREEIAELVPLPPEAKPSILQKILVRTLIVLSSFGFLFLIGFGYWHFFVRNKPGQELLPSPSSTPLLTPSPSESVSPLVPPAPIFPVKEIKILDINPPEKDLKTALNKINEEVIGSGFFELMIRKQETTLVPSELLKELEISSPENLFNAVSDNVNDFDFMLYRKENGVERHALLVKIKDGGEISKVLTDWELLISKEGLSVFNEKISALSPRFKTLNYKNVQIRFLTISKADLGACYAVVNNYLIFSTSLEAIEKMIDSNALTTVAEKSN
ncbi:MAG: hypothetical protein Q8N56_02380 [bacterium]|nr:hypothetical protein [bacterium]